MLVLFCAGPLAPRRPDLAYAREVAAVEALGVRYGLIGFEALLDGDSDAAIRRVPATDAGELAVYRGWMLRPEQYRLLYEALAERGVRLVNDPDAYAFAHLFPNGYAAIAAHTPRSVWLATDGDIAMDEVMAALRPFGDRPIVIKDFVKSRKHEWAEACFIPSASDRAAVERVVRRFLALQGPDLVGGLVFREFVPLASLGRHPRSGMPLGEEYRCFIVDGAPVYRVEYWDAVAYDAPPPSPDWLPAVAAAVGSRFFTLDLARRADGEWLAMELGDGQVAGLPDRADPVAFYRGLVGRLEPSRGANGTQPASRSSVAHGTIAHHPPAKEASATACASPTRAPRRADPPLDCPPGCHPAFICRAALTRPPTQAIP